MKKLLEEWKKWYKDSNDGATISLTGGKMLFRCLYDLEKLLKSSLSTSTNEDLPILELLNLEGSIKATVNIIVKAVVDLIQDDPHQWSTRPCSTCQTITTLTERPFGCMKYKIDREKK